jgi:hypothetical protein
MTLASGSRAGSILAAPGPFPPRLSDLRNCRTFANSKGLGCRAGTRLADTEPLRHSLSGLREAGGTATLTLGGLVVVLVLDWQAQGPFHHVLFFPRTGRRVPNSERLGCCAGSKTVDNTTLLIVPSRSARSWSTHPLSSSGLAVVLVQDWQAPAPAHQPDARAFRLQRAGGTYGGRVEEMRRVGPPAGTILAGRWLPQSSSDCCPYQEELRAGSLTTLT